MRPPRTSLRVFVLAALVPSALAGSAGAATYRGVTGVQSGHVAWIHRRPDATSPHVGYLKAGTLHVRTLECRTLAAGGWCHVSHEGTSGWVQDRYLKAAPVMRG